MRAFLLIPALALTLSAQTAPEKPKIGTPTPSNLGPLPPHLTAPKEEAIPVDQVIARLGKRIIREKDFLEWMKITSGKRFEMVAKLPGGLTRARHQYLDVQMLAAKARKARLQESAEFKKILAIQEDQALVGFMMSEDREGGEGQRLKQKAENPSEEQLKAFFEKNAQRYETPEKFTARHILVGLKGAPRMGDKGLTEEEAKARIAKIQDELKAGKSFESLAKEYSDDPGNKANGGLYKDAIYGSFVQEFQDAVRRQEVGKVGEPVKTMYGYHLILVEGRTPKQPGEFDKVKDRVKQQWTAEQRDSLRKAFLEETRKEMDFVSGPEAAESLPKPAPANVGKKSAKP